MNRLIFLALSIFISAIRSSSGQIFASDLTGAPSVNLVSFVNNAPPFTSPADGFGVYQRGVSASIPFDFLDDSTVFSSDSIGIIKTGDTDPFFGAADTVNDDTTGPVSATWTFNISSASEAFQLSIDIGAMGDFEAADSFTWTYSIDGTSSITAFSVSVDEAASQEYTLESGTIVTLNDPAKISSVVLTNELQTFTFPVTETGGELALTFTADTNGGGEAVVFRNIKLLTGSVETPSPVETPPPTPAPTLPLTPIYDIQGSQQATESDAAPRSPLVGSTVKTTGIITAIDSNGFYMQDPTGDGDDTTSDAIFCFASVSGLSIGDEVSATGPVSEFIPGGSSSNNQPTTQLFRPTIAVLSSGNPLPAPVLIGGASGRKIPTTSILDAINFYESLESMRITVVDTVAVAATNRFGEIFAVTRSDGSPDTSSPLSERGTLNIAEGDFNPEKLQIDEDSGVFSFDFPTVKVGATLGDITGVVSFSFGNYEIIPTEDFTASISDSQLQPSKSSLVKSEKDLLLATYNVLNLDPNDSDGDSDVANGRFSAIAAQIVSNMNSPDVIGLQEVQDDNGSVNDGTVSAASTLQTLIDAIVDVGGPSYQFIDNTFITDLASGGQPGGNIRTAFLYDPERVTVVPGSVQTIGGQGPGEAFEGARLPLVASFLFNEEIITVINVHFSSKGGSVPILGTVQPFESRQEDVSVNGSLDERQQQSKAVQSFIGTLPEASNVVVLGDFNEFEFISPVKEFSTNIGFKNLADYHDPNEVYTFEFQGNSQALDHILVSPSLEPFAISEFVHVNAEFPELPSRASDHDPIVALLAFSKPCINFPCNEEGTRYTLCDQTARLGAKGPTYKNRCWEPEAIAGALGKKYEDDTCGPCPA